MSKLLLRTYLEQIADALQLTFALALGVRLAPVANVAALRAVATMSLTGTTAMDEDRIDIRFCTAAGVAYYFDAYSLASDDGNLVVAPTDVTGGLPGRWLKSTSTVQAGYLRDVVLWNGEETEDSLESRIFGHSPCLVIAWEGGENERLSRMEGGIYQKAQKFSLWCVSENLRQRRGFRRPGIVSEAATDPGAYRILGDVEATISQENQRDVQKDNPFSQQGIQFVQPGSTSVLAANLDERRAVVALEIEVRAAVVNTEPDTEGPSPLVTPDELTMQPVVTSLNDAPCFDPLNFVVSGFDVLPGIGLTQDVAPGSAYVGGVLFTYAGQVGASFDADSDSYVDMGSDGTPSGTVVSADSPPPPLAAGALRIAVITTDSIGVIAFHRVAATASPVGDPVVAPIPAAPPIPS